MKIWCLVSVDPWVSSCILPHGWVIRAWNAFCLYKRVQGSLWALDTLLDTMKVCKFVLSPAGKIGVLRLRSQNSCYEVVLLGRNLWAQPEKSHKVLWCRRGWLQIIRAQRCHSDLYPGSLSSRRCSCNCLAARLSSMHSCPSQNKHTYSTVQKTRNLNCAVGSNVNGTAMLENKMEVP